MEIIGVNPAIMWSQDHFLRKPSRELTKEEVLSSEFREFVKTMFKALYESPIGVGLAAPQLGIQVRVVVIDIKRNGKKPLVLVNPSFEPVYEDTIDSDETCLSFPNLMGCVKRYKTVKVRAKDLTFTDIEFESDSFLGIVCQHEIDHLNGVVYVDKAQDCFEPQNRYEAMATQVMKKLFAQES